MNFIKDSKKAAIYVTIHGDELLRESNGLQLYRLRCKGDNPIALKLMLKVKNDGYAIYYGLFDKEMGDWNNPEAWEYFTSKTSAITRLGERKNDVMHLILRERMVKY